MNPVEPDKQQERSEPESITQGVAEVVSAFLGVGASLAKTVAEATANTKPVPAPSPTATPLNAIIHYGLITVGNVINLFAGGIKNTASTAANASTNVGTQGKGQAVRGAAATTTSSSGMTGSDGTLPLVQRGGTLRIPLSIENPVNEPMEQLTFLCLAMQGGTPGQGIPLTVAAVRFQPETLSIAPRDFEKLTVFIDTSHETSPGRYEAALGLGSGNFELTVQFEVLPQTI